MHTGPYVVHQCYHISTLSTWSVISRTAIGQYIPRGSASTLSISNTFLHNQPVRWPLKARAVGATWAVLAGTSVDDLLAIGRLVLFLIISIVCWRSRRLISLLWHWPRQRSHQRLSSHNIWIHEMKYNNYLADVQYRTSYSITQGSRSRACPRPPTLSAAVLAWE